MTHNPGEFRRRPYARLQLLLGDRIDAHCSRPCRTALMPVPESGASVVVDFGTGEPATDHHFDAPDDGAYFLVADRTGVAVTWERTSGVRVVERGAFGRDDR
jgi:hypothetical protein